MKLQIARPPANIAADGSLHGPPLNQSVAHMNRRNAILCIVTCFCTWNLRVALAQTKADEELSEGQIAAAVEASRKVRGEVHFWRSDKLRLIFGYDERWTFANPSQRSTETVINWRARQSGGLMATCYLEATTDSGIAKMTHDDIRQRSRQVVDSVLRNSHARDPRTRLVTWRAASQDNLPVVYLERDMRIQNLNDSYSMRVYSIVTSWNGRAINFECASEIPLKMPRLAATVEAPIERVLGSLQFIREPR